MDDDLDIPAFLDRRLRPSADGKSSIQECNPPETSGQQQAPHAAPSAPNVGLRARSNTAHHLLTEVHGSLKMIDEKEDPAGQGGADKNVRQENKETDGTVSDIPQRDGRANSGGVAD
jgi:hypothetical protein